MNNFFDKEFRNACIREYEKIRFNRKAFKGKPDKYDLLEIELDRMFSSFYKKIIG